MSLPTLSKTKTKTNRGKAKINASGFLIINVVLEKKEEKFRKKNTRREGEGVEGEEWLKRVFPSIEISRCLFR